MPSISIPLSTLLIAGTKYRCTSANLANLRVGDIVTLDREPQNTHDPNAIGCYAYVKDGPKHIGYIPAKFAAFFAPIMDLGRIPMYAEVIEVQPAKLSIHIRLFLKLEQEIVEILRVEEASNGTPS